jgi:predicted nucleotidyltransferase
MFTRKTAIVQATQFLTELKQFGLSPERAVLFGSVVRGKQHELSDIDLAVWDSSFTGVLGLDYEKILPVLRPYKMLELHTFTPSETAENNPFVKEILRTGIELPV